MIALLLASCLLCPPWVVGGVSDNQSWWYAQLARVPTFAVVSGTGYLACEQRGPAVYDCVLTAQGAGRTLTTVDGEVIERRWAVYAPLLR